MSAWSCAKEGGRSTATLNAKSAPVQNLFFYHRQYAIAMSGYVKLWRNSWRAPVEERSRFASQSGEVEIRRESL